MTEAARHAMERVTSKRPCPCCESTSWCMRGETMVLCMRVKSDKPKELRDGSVGWLHPTGTAPQQPTYQPPQKPRLTDAAMHNRWAPKARAWWTGEEAWKRVQDAAEALGVAESALAELCVGWDGTATTWPERSGAGLIVGVKRRLPDGVKVYHVGSRAGLSYSETFADNEGPILIVEGGSDVAAAITMGLAAVGRPSNTGGVPYLTRLLRPLDRQIMVIGERDRKQHAELKPIVREKHPERCGGCALCWPGWYGALSVAVRLQQALKRTTSVKAALLPGTCKDTREFLQASGVDVANQSACYKLGTSLLRRLT